MCAGAYRRGQKVAIDVAMNHLVDGAASSLEFAYSRMKDSAANGGRRSAS